MVRFRRSSLYAKPAPYGMLRILSMVFMLGVLSMMYQRAADPHSWKWLAALDEENVPARPAAVVEAVHAQADLPVVPPAEQEQALALDPDERDAAREEFQAVSDRTPLDAPEMASYWRLVRWSRSQPFAELEKRARHDLVFTNLWEQPEKYRGELIQLRLHIKRVLSHEAPENPADVKTVYEAWGWTDESRSFPYLVVFSELPPEMPLGPDIHEEAVFVGYFHKIMSYQAYDAARGAPLLIGQLKYQRNEAREALRHRDDGSFWPAAAIGGTVVLMIIGSWVFKSRWSRSRRRAIGTTEVATGAEWWEQMRSAGDHRPFDPEKFGEQGNGHGGLFDDQTR